MQNVKATLFAGLLICSGFINLSAQQAFPTSGSNLSGTGGSVSYSVGQVVASFFSGSNGSVIQGVQQPYEISVVTGEKEADGIILDFRLYPNPASDMIMLKVANYPIDNLKYNLYDINGTLVGNGKVDSEQTSIPLARLPVSTYMLKLIDNQKQIKIFKIIKK
jgi:hypothetical protein